MANDNSGITHLAIDGVDLPLREEVPARLNRYVRSTNHWCKPHGWHSQRTSTRHDRTDCAAGWRKTSTLTLPQDGGRWHSALYPNRDDRRADWLWRGLLHRWRCGYTARWKAQSHSAWKLPAPAGITFSVWSV